MLTVPEYNINAQQREFAGHTGRVFDVDLGQDGLCVTASEDGTAKVWRLADGRLEGEVAQSASKDEVLRVAWAPPIVRDAAGASLLAVAGADGFCNLWRGDDWSAPKSIQRLDHGGDQVYGCAWSACGDAYGAWLLTAAGAAVRTWDVNAGKSIKQWSYQEPRGDQAYVFDCVEIKILRRVCAESSLRPPRHRRDACSMAWRCRFLAAPPSQDSRVIVIAEK